MNTKSNTIFTDNFPECKNDKELAEAIELFPQYDPYYVVSGCLQDRKEFFDLLWGKFEPYADRHFNDQIKVSFHQRSREMYMGKTLLDNNLSIKSNNEWPDFIINDHVYIECVACTKGDSESNTVPEMHCTKYPDLICLQETPTDKMILRITSVIQDKAITQYDWWKKKSRLNKDAPFIIAINTGDLGHSQTGLILKALFGMGNLRINRNGERGHERKDNIPKWNGSPISVNYFTASEYNFISGILWSDKYILNMEENDNFILVNNPYAINPINMNDFLFWEQWRAEQQENWITLNHYKKNTEQHH